MQEKEIRFRQKRELGQVMSDSFDFLKQESKPLFRLILVYVVPFIVLYVIAQIYFQKNVLTRFDFTDPEAMQANIGPIYLNAVIFLGFFLFIQSLLAGTFYSYIEAYVKKGRGNFELSDIAPHFFSNSLMALGAGIVFAVLTLFGSMFCLLPGIYLANTLSLVFIGIVFEKKGLSSAMSKSWKLVNAQWWNTFALNLLGIIFVIGVSLLLSVPLMLISTSQGLEAGTSGTLIEYPQWYWVVNGISSVISTALFIVLYTFMAFQYFNLEERSNPTLPPDVI